MQPLAVFSQSLHAQAAWLLEVEAASSAAARLQAVAALLDTVEGDPDFRDADRLAFQELLAELEA